MALLWVHPSILLHIAGDHWEKRKISTLPQFLWYLKEYITDPNWDHYFQMSTDSGCFIGLSNQFIILLHFKNLII